VLALGPQLIVIFAYQTVQTRMDQIMDEEHSMELWAYWLNVLDGLLGFLSSQVGLGEGLATAIQPYRQPSCTVSWRAAFVRGR
jgi:hypothetical protein